MEVGNNPPFTCAWPHARGSWRSAVAVVIGAVSLGLSFIGSGSSRDRGLWIQIAVSLDLIVGAYLGQLRGTWRVVGVGGRCVCRAASNFRADLGQATAAADNLQSSHE